MSYTRPDPKPAPKPKGKRRPLCKCGKVCAWYGPVGGYSVACVDCNRKNATRQRAGRLRRRGNTSHAKRPRDFPYMERVAQLACLARLLSARGNECAPGTVVHHMFGRYGAESDRKTVPFCDKHHREWHEARGAFEGWGKERRRTYALWSCEYTRLEVAP